MNLVRAPFFQRDLSCFYCIHRIRFGDEVQRYTSMDVVYWYFRTSLCAKNLLWVRWKDVIEIENVDVHTNLLFRKITYFMSLVSLWRLWRNEGMKEWRNELFNRSIDHKMSWDHSKTLCDGWWLMADDWWLMADGWWLMADGWWLMNDEWWMMNDEWWLSK